MSELPKPSSQKAPKHIGGHGARVKEQAHDQLVRFVWTHLQAVIDAVLPAREDFFDRADRAVEEFRQEASIVAQRARQLAGDVSDPPVGKALLKLATKFDAGQSIAIGVPPPTLANVRINSATVQSALYEHGANRVSKQVGFVDFECRLVVPERLVCKCPMPVFMTAEGMRIRHLQRLSKNKDLTLREVSDAPAVAPMWQTEGRERVVMIDVRPAAVPVGQLLQELKTLRSVAHGADVLVVMESRDALVETMLRNERISCLSRQQIEARL